MKNKCYMFIAMWFGIGIVGTFICAFFGLDCLCSFGFGFVAFSTVCGSSFIGILRQIKAQRLEAQNIASNIDSINKQTISQASDTQGEQASKQDTQKIPFSSRFIVGTRLSLSFLRLLSYLALVAGVLVLTEVRLMQPQALLLGIFCSLGVTLLGAVIIIKAT